MCLKNLCALCDLCGFDVSDRFLGDLMKELKRSVSIVEILMYLLKCRKNKPSEFAGGWKMDENEVEKIKSELKEIWKRWEL